MMERGTIPKHEEFYSKNKSERLVHLIGFIIRTYKSLLLHCMEVQIGLLFYQNYIILSFPAESAMHVSPGHPAATVT